MPKNIFVVGLEDFNLRFLQRVRHAETYAFHQLLDYNSAATDPDVDVNALLRRAFAQLGAFEGTIDAIVGYWDFPTVLMMPILRKRYGLDGPSLESVLQCEHKYWSRHMQKEALPDMVPPFALVDPFAEGAEDSPPLPFPFWIKPVKAHSSLLGFRVRNVADYRDALATIRKGIEYWAVNLNQIMEYADIPADLTEADGWTCIAEGIISSGRQCTLEGYVLDGDIEVYGVVDSIRGPNRSSFERYQYPSTLPGKIKHRMIAAARTAIGHSGLDNSPFNIEFFWNRGTDRIWLLEINARISKSHSPLFDKVEGVPHNEVMIDVALGRKPEYPLGQGAFRHAAKCMYRRYDCRDEQVVTRAPEPEEIATIEARFPGCEINSHVRTGMRLGDLHFQDSYSHELAEIFVGSNSQSGLMRAYHEIVEALDIRIGDAS